MTTQDVEIPRVTGYRILNSDPEFSSDPVLVLTTEAGDHHFVLSRPMFQKLSAACAKAGRESDKP